MPFLFLLYLTSYLDRINVSYAGLEMTRDLGFNNAVFGLGQGIFFLGYLLLEVPGAILVERWSARKWIARILISWGAFAALTGLIRSSSEFYSARFLLGLAEAGFFPGILVYVSHWYRQEDRAKAVTFFMIGIPFSEIIGAPVSGLLLKVHWLGFAGWRWLFLLEGAPAIVLGIITLYYLTDRPAQAHWLTAEERSWILGELDRERRVKPPAPSIGEVLRHPTVILLSLAYFGILSANWGFTLWLPKIVQRLSGLSPLKVSLISAIPFLIEIPFLLLLASHSDRTGERRWHVSIPVGIGAIAFFVFGSSERMSSNVVLAMVLFSIAAIGLHGYRASFWTLPTIFLSETAAATAIGVINCFGNLGGFLGPYMVGWLSNNSGSYRTAMLFLGSCALMASLMVAAVRVSKRLLPVMAAFLLFCVTCSAQLPPSGKVPSADEPLFRAEIGRLEKLLSNAPDKPAVSYQIARTWAYAKQWPETIDWLRKVVGFKVGLDPSRDSIFSDLRGTREFEEILATVRASTPRVSHSIPAFDIAEGDLTPESIAYDRSRKKFYLGSMRKGKVLRCTPAGQCAEFASGLGTVLGLKVHGEGLWLLNNVDTKSELVHYDLASAQVIRRYTVAGTAHNFNDLAIAVNGRVYLTDTRAGTVWSLSWPSAELTQLPGRFPSANGIALSVDESLLYVSTFPDGITILDLKTQTATPIARPEGLSLATIDGLYFYRGDLIAIQNGFMTPRVVRFRLSRNLRAIESLAVLERRHPLFDGITTGVLVGREFFYMANIQDDKQTGFSPIRVLKLYL